jgi:hypothetical protein
VDISPGLFSLVLEYDGVRISWHRILSSLGLW